MRSTLAKSSCWSLILLSLTACSVTVRVPVELASVQTHDGPATRVVFVSQPSNGVAGSALATQPILELQNAQGYRVTTGPDANAQITLSLSSGTGTLLGNATVLASGGQASFAGQGLEIDLAGAKTLTATKADTSAAGGSGPMTVASASFTISPGSPSAANSTIAVAPTSITASNGSSSGTITVTLKDSFGNPINGTSVTLSATGSANTLSQPASTTSSSGQASGSISSTKAETKTLTIASPSGLSALQASLTVNPAAPAKLDLSGSNIVKAQSCSPNYQVHVLDAFGNLSTPSASLPIALSGAGAGAFYSDSSCTTAVTSYSQSTSSQLVYIKDPNAEALTLTATDGSATPLSPGSKGISIYYSLTITGSTTVASDACDGPYAITPMDNLGAARSYTTDKTLNLSGFYSTGYGAFYASTDPTCTTPITSTTLTSGSTEVDFYIKPIKAELNTLNASSADPTVSQGSLGVTTQAGAPAALSVNGPSVIAPSTCSPAYTVLLLDSVLNTTTTSTGVTIDLSAAGSGGGTQTFYSDSSCTTQITQLSIASGNGSGQFYVKDTAAESLTLSAADSASVLTSSTFLAQVDSVAPSLTVQTGQNQTCALLNGAVHCWGYNGDGSLGDGTTTDSLIPVEPTGLGSGVSAIASGQRHVCAIVSGAGFCWGGNWNGQAGSGAVPKLTPGMITGLESGVTALALGTAHSCAIKDGGVYCWGGNSQGQLGRTGADSSTASPATGLGDSVTTIAAGMSHTCAIRQGALYCWGTNGDGQLGYSAGAYSATPTVVPGAASGVTDVSAGTYHTCAVINGAVHCWGVYVGDPNPPITSGVEKLASGSDFACVLLTDGTVKCWGTSYNNSNNTASVTGLPADVTDLDLGEDSLCFVIGGRDIQCVGGNRWLNLGIGAINKQTLPFSSLSLN